MCSPRDQEALSLWQANRNSPEIEALLDAFFNFPTKEEFKRQMSCVSEIMSCPSNSISTSQFPSSSSEAL